MSMRPQRQQRGKAIRAKMLNDIASQTVRRVSMTGGIAANKGGDLTFAVKQKFVPRIGRARWFRITASAQVASNKQWTYTATRLSKSTAGYGGWADHATDTTSYTLYNTMEDQNGATGTYGNGSNQTDIDAVNGGAGTFDLVAVPNGTRVAAWSVILATGGVEWWFAAPNGVTGQCS